MLKAMKEIFKYIGLLFLSMLIVSVVALIFTSTPPTALLYMGSAFLFMVFALISLKRKKVNILELCSFHKITIKDIIFSVLLAISFLFVYGGISGLTGIDNLIPDGNDYYNKYQKMEKNGIISMSISIALVAPFFEEFIFRGLIFGVMQKSRLNIFVAIVVQALLFGLIHLNLYQGIFAFFIGIFLALALYWTGSIWSSIVMHFTVNSLAVIVILFSDSVYLNEKVPQKDFILPLIIGVVLMYIAIKHFLSIKIRASR